MYYNTKYNTIQNTYVFSCKKYIICLKACLFGRLRWLGRKIGRPDWCENNLFKASVKWVKYPILNTYHYFAF